MRLIGMSQMRIQVHKWCVLRHNGIEGLFFDGGLPQVN